MACPSISARVAGKEVHILIDTGSHVTCLSHKFYSENLTNFAQCPKLSITNLQVHGFTGEKSVRTRTQIRAEIDIQGVTKELNLLIIPHLVRPCILGIDSQKELGALLDISNDTVRFRVEGKKTELKYQPSILPRMEVEYICNIEYYEDLDKNEENETLWKEARKKIENL